MKPKILPSYEELHSVFEYDPIEGNLFWKISPNKKIHIGDFAGWVDSQGYFSVTYNKQAWKCHRIAWKMYYNEEPPEVIDHKDTNILNFKIDNLRKATNAQNGHNRAMNSNNTSGVKGLCLIDGKWRARVTVDGKSKQKRFYDYDEAVDWIKNQRILLHKEFVHPSDAY